MMPTRGVAQLGLARSVRDAEVEGSNPSSPTISPTIVWPRLPLFAFVYLALRRTSRCAFPQRSTAVT
jgi:hypothetical protein